MTIHIYKQVYFFKMFCCCWVGASNNQIFFMSIYSWYKFGLLNRESNHYPIRSWAGHRKQNIFYMNRANWESFRYFFPMMTYPSSLKKKKYIYPKVYGKQVNFIVLILSTHSLRWLILPPEVLQRTRSYYIFLNKAVLQSHLQFCVTKNLWNLDFSHSGFLPL